jgi:type IV secretion system protein VirB5
MNVIQQLKKALLVAAIVSGGATVAHAQIPVTDAASIGQTIMNHAETIAKWKQQYDQMKETTEKLQQQIQETQAVWNTLKGNRNLGSILNNDLLTQYLPQDYQAAAKALQSGSGEFTGISGSLQDIVKQSQLKSCAELNSDPAQRDACAKQWQALALNKQVGDMGYKKAAENIANLQQYIQNINGSTDQKAISEVAARIQVETVRMQNEQIKLQTISMMEEADRKLKQQQTIDSFNGAVSKGANGGIRF